MTGRLAVWSGPRNVSTALMRSWENRPDSIVIDEPLYAYYLARTGLDHPGRDEVLAAGETDWRTVVKRLRAPAPSGVQIVYEKHMAHHLLPEVERSWLRDATNVLLIRDPREVVASYVRSRSDVTVDDVGLRQQVSLYDDLDAAGMTPSVIDAADFLREPERYLRALCELVAVPFVDSMLRWPPGPRDSDGVWAPYWYASVWKSTGFTPPAQRDIELTGAAAVVAEECRPFYQQLHGHRWRP